MPTQGTAPSESTNPPSITTNPPLVTSAPSSSQIQSPFPIQNIHNMVSIKLNKDNFITWKFLFLPVLKSFNLLHHIDGTPPPPQIITSNGVPQINPEYTVWQQNDQTILIWFNATISEEYLSYSIGYNTARDLWINLEKRFANLSRSHVLQLKSQLQSLTKGSNTISAYLKEIKSISDSL